MFRKLLLYILFFVFCSNLSVINAADFKFDYDVTLNVNESGRTKVIQNITITNLTSQLYAQNYSLTIGTQRIDEVKAADSTGNIIPMVTSESGQTTINVPFAAKVVGVGQQLPFTLNFTSGDIAIKKGRIWEIIIPGIELNPNLNSYTIKLNVPSFFGQPVFISPKSQAERIWQLSEHLGKGIRLIYGDYQSYRYSINYFLPYSSQSEYQEITLIPDTAFQKSILSRLSPLPINVTTDRDGNWLARYQVPKNGNLNITAEGDVLEYVNPQKEYKSQLSQADKKLYTRELPFWEQTPQIASIAANLKNPKKIYDWVVDNLTYDYNRVNIGNTRIGAAKVIENPASAVCTEFSDLFISLARANQIPARELQGYAYTTNSRLQPLSLSSDVLHAWVEYYSSDLGFWIPVDPTWANTTKGADFFTQPDFNHVVFTILGEKSDYPYPAGSFKADKNSKDVYIDFSKDEISLPKPEIELMLNLPSKIYSGIKQSGQIIITNKGKVMIPATKLQLDQNLPISMTADKSQNIPPYGFEQIKLTTFMPLSFISKEFQFKLIYGDKQVNQKFVILPIYQFPLFQITVLILGGIGLIILFRNFKQS